ncbi:MAG: hypothetical protein IJ471_06055 [Eubacterium sp.]|nr:hypothetical protein [Eubacterium sp.]
MRKEKFRGLLILVLILIAVTACGSVYAYMFKQTEEKKNQFTPAQVSCEVVEQTDTPLTQKNSIKVKNTSNIDAYLRVRLVSYWVNDLGDGNYEIVAKESELPEITPMNGWIKGSNDTYYYTIPVAPESQSPNNLTTELLNASIVLTEEDGYKQVIEVFAEAIQSEPQSAVTNSWGVTLGADGMITAAP